MNRISRAGFLRGDWRGLNVPPSPLAVARVASACLTYRGVHCRSCADACEPEAIAFHPQVGSVARPEINPQQCTGCGDCRAVCPVQAIVFFKRDVNGEST